VLGRSEYFLTPCGQKWLTWPFFILRHIPAVQRWVLEPWFQNVRRRTRADVRFLDPPVSTAAGPPSEGAALLQRLRGTLRLWLHGQSGMGKSSVFAAWERAYFIAEDAPNLNAAVRRYGFILIMHPTHHYSALPVPDARNLGCWRQCAANWNSSAGHARPQIDRRDARQFPQTRLLVTFLAPFRFLRLQAEVSPSLREGSLEEFGACWEGLDDDFLARPFRRSFLWPFQRPDGS
jgi:hypothetical protein